MRVPPAVPGRASVGTPQRGLGGVERSTETSEVGRPEDHAILRGDVHQIEVDSGPGDPASQVDQYAGAVLDIDHDHFPLPGDPDMGNRQCMLHGPGMRDEDVELRPLAWPDAGGGCDVHASIADRGRNTRQRPRGVLDVDDQVDRHGSRARSAYLDEPLPTDGCRLREASNLLSLGRELLRRVEPRGRTSTTEGMAQMPNGVQERQPTGWTVFAGMALVIVGSLDALWGLAAILNDQVLVVGGHGAIVADITTWGWVHLILGSIVALTGMALFTGNSTARWLAVFFVTVSAISQIVWFPLAPLWAFLIIILDVTIIYQLTARWEA
jgi:hypothetical protein